MNVMIVHVLLCNLFLYKLFMHACVVAQSTLCTLSSVLLSFLSRIILLNRPLLGPRTLQFQVHFIDYLPLCYH